MMTVNLMNIQMIQMTLKIQVILMILVMQKIQKIQKIQKKGIWKHCLTLQENGSSFNLEKLVLTKFRMISFNLPGITAMFSPD